MAKDFINPEYIRWCCEKMKEAANSLRYPIEIEAITRTYCVPSMWPHGGRGLKLDYCPWCKKALPDLEKKRTDILEKEYGVKITDDIFKDDPKIPNDFYDERWWVKRGL